MSKMRRCLGCKREFKPETDEEMFCSEKCRGWCRTFVGIMTSKLKSDESIFSAFDHLQLLLKKEEQGGEEV